MSELAISRIKPDELAAFQTATFKAAATFNFSRESQMVFWAKAEVLEQALGQKAKTPGGILCRLMGVAADRETSLFGNLWYNLEASGATVIKASGDLVKHGTKEGYLTLSGQRQKSDCSGEAKDITLEKSREFFKFMLEKGVYADDFNIILVERESSRRKIPYTIFEIKPKNVVINGVLLDGMQIAIADAEDHRTFASRQQLSDDEWEDCFVHDLEHEHKVKGFVHNESWLKRIFQYLIEEKTPEAPKFPSIRLPNNLLTRAEIVERMKLFNKVEGRYPGETDRNVYVKSNSGQICTVIGDSWNAIRSASREGLRGLPKYERPARGPTLLEILIEEGLVEKRSNLTRDIIARWQDATHEATGKWAGGSKRSANTPQEHVYDFVMDDNKQIRRDENGKRMTFRVEGEVWQNIVRAVQEGWRTLEKPPTGSTRHMQALRKEYGLGQ